MKCGPWTLWRIWKLGILGGITFQAPVSSLNRWFRDSQGNLTWLSTEIIFYWLGQNIPLIFLTYHLNLLYNFESFEDKIFFSSISPLFYILVRYPCFQHTKVRRGPQTARQHHKSQDLGSVKLHQADHKKWKVVPIRVWLYTLITY